MKTHPLTKQIASNYNSLNRFLQLLRDYKKLENTLESLLLQTKNLDPITKRHKGIAQQTLSTIGQELSEVKFHIETIKQIIKFEKEQNNWANR